jgi:hypothetical protein
MPLKSPERWRWPFRYRGSRRESAVAQLSTLGIVSHFMRISHLTTAALMAAFILGCSKQSPTTPVKAAAPDVGVVDFTDHTPKCYSLGGDKSCTISGVTDSHGITIDVLFQTTNADKTLQTVGTGNVYVSPGHPCIVSSGGVSVRFMPKF